MGAPLATYSYLGIAIVCEVIGTVCLQKSEQFSRMTPTLAMTALYLCAFFFLSQALKGMPLGVAYAVWAGLGIILTAVAGFILFKQSLDTAAILGILMIVGGVIVIQLFSKTATH